MTAGQAIEVSTETAINHWELGRQFFEWSSEEQARFLHGMAVGFSDLGAWSHMQVSYIVDAAKVDKTEGEIFSLIELLRDYFEATD